MRYDLVAALVTDRSFSDYLPRKYEDSVSLIRTSPSPIEGQGGILEIHLSDLTRDEAFIAAKEYARRDFSVVVEVVNPGDEVEARHTYVPSTGKWESEDLTTDYADHAANC